MTMDLRAENELLREQLIQMKELLAPSSIFPTEWKLTRCDEAVLSSLIAAPDGRRSNEALHAAIGGLEPDTDPKIIQVYICRLRKRADLGIQIETIHGRGYALTAALRAHLKNAISEYSKQRRAA